MHIVLMRYSSRKGVDGFARLMPQFFLSLRRSGFGHGWDAETTICSIIGWLGVDCKASTEA
jgi:hypothetical protein